MKILLFSQLVIRLSVLISCVVAGFPNPRSDTPFVFQLVSVYVCVRVCLYCRLCVCVLVPLLIAETPHLASRPFAPKLITPARCLCGIVCSSTDMRVSLNLLETLSKRAFFSRQLNVSRPRERTSQLNVSRPCVRTPIELCRLS